MSKSAALSPGVAPGVYSSRRMPDVACTSCGVLHCLHVTASHTEAARSALIVEATRSARTLGALMEPKYPMHLEASSVALERLGDGLGLWTSHRRLIIVPELWPMLAERRKLCQAMRYSNQTACIQFLLHNVTDSQSPWPFVWKLSSLLRSPFSRTLFLDADTYILWPPYVHVLLHQTLPFADVVMPLDVGRTFPPWSRVGAPPLCTCVMAYRSNSETRALLLNASERLIRHKHKHIRQGDQQMIYMQMQSQPDSPLRVITLPEEASSHPSLPPTSCRPTRA